MAYKPTTAKYKGATKVVYVVYKKPHSYRGVVHPRTIVNKVYISGRLVKTLGPGVFTKKSGRSVYGLKFIYENPRAAYHRKSFVAKRGSTRYKVSAADVGRTRTLVSKVIELPRSARNVRVYSKLPARYRGPLQAVR